MLFNGISRYLRQILKYRFCTISSRELSVRAIFYAISNYGFRLILLLNLIFFILRSSLRIPTQQNGNELDSAINWSSSCPAGTY